MNILHNLIYIHDNVIPKDLCELIINNFDSDNAQNATIMQGTETNQTDNSIRDTKLNWESPMSPIGCILQSYIYQANKQAGWDYNISHMEKIQMCKYDRKGFYDWHIDTCPPDAHEIQRKISIVAMLSNRDDFHGGDLEIKNLTDYGYEQNTIKLKQGSIVCFPSYLEHRVTPVLYGQRYTAVGWMSGRKWV